MKSAQAIEMIYAYIFFHLTLSEGTRSLKITFVKGAWIFFYPDLKDVSRDLAHVLNLCGNLCHLLSHQERV